MAAASALEEPCSWCAAAADGWTDISPGRAKHQLHKRVLREGDPAHGRPAEGCPCFVQLVGRLLAGGAIYETTRDVVDGRHVGGTDDPLEFQLLRESDKLPRGVDAGVATMLRGEVCRLIVSPELGYGAAGLAPKVLPGQWLDVEVELLRWGDSLPRFPSPEELARSRREREEEEVRQAEANPGPTLGERIAESQTHRERGNELFRAGELEAAQKAYDAAFVHIFHSQEMIECLTAEELSQWRTAKLPLHLNRAATKLKRGKVDEALWDCDQALEIDPGSAKGHFRRAKVYVAKLERELGKEAQGVFWDPERGEELVAEARRSLDACKRGGAAGVARLERELAAARQRLQAALAQYRAQQRQLSGSILGGLERENAQAESREAAARARAEAAARAAAEAEADDADLPPLE